MWLRHLWLTDFRNYESADLELPPGLTVVHGDTDRVPWGGGTFPDVQISEEGRSMLAGLLEQLSVMQLRELFDASGVTAHDQVSATARSADAWVRTFLDRVRQIASAGPCPS